VPSLNAWAKSLGGFEFPLLSDFYPHGHCAIQYGILRGNGRPERAIFVVDRAGKIVYVDIHDINEPPPTPPILAVLDKLK
jgi:peroxiredoxin